MGIVDQLKQYGNLIIVFLITIGFGGTMFVYGGGGGQTDTGEEQEMNFTAPSEKYRVGTFNKSYT
jgi:hypothetical protein